MRARLAGWIAVLACALAAAAEGAVPEGRSRAPEADPGCLERLRQRVDSLSAVGATPIVIFDIDGTLFDPAPRHEAIFRRYAAEHPEDAPALLPKLEGLPHAAYAYAPESTLHRMGVTDTALVRRIRAAWVRDFFSNRDLAADAPLPGAAAYVRDLWERGAFVVYLTGRDVPRMLEGTVASLRDHGFPVAAPRVSCVLKPEPRMRDADFKDPALDQIASVGVVCGVFENEPGNLNLMADRFPAADAIFVDTNHSPGAPPVRARASWIRSFAPR